MLQFRHRKSAGITPAGQKKSTIIKNATPATPAAAGETR
jgi:hypothetical protein